MQEFLRALHGINVDVDQVCREVARAESLIVVMVNALGISSDLDNMVVCLVGHIHHCYRVHHWVSHAGIVGMHLAVPVLLPLNVGAVWAGGRGRGSAFAFAVFFIISGSTPLGILGSIYSCFLPGQAVAASKVIMNKVTISAAGAGAGSRARARSSTAIQGLQSSLFNLKRFHGRLFKSSPLSINIGNLIGAADTIGSLLGAARGSPLALPLGAISLQLLHSWA